MRARATKLGIAVRPGATMGLVVSVVVGLVGLVQLDQRLMLIGLIAGPVLLALNAIVVGVRDWHWLNTQPESTYVGAEDMIRLRRLQSNRRVK